MSGDLDDRVVWSQLITQSYTTAGIQLAFALLARQLHYAAQLTTRAARAHADRLARQAAEDTRHAERWRRYHYMRERIAPLLRDLAEGRADPGDDAVRRVERDRGGAAASAVRRDGGRSPILCCTNSGPAPMSPTAGDVDITFVCYGELPDVPVVDSAAADRGAACWRWRRRRSWAG